MEITLIVIFVLTALLLNLVIVLQPGKGSGMGALGGGGGSAMGGGASSVFGARGAVPFLSKLTAWLAALFMLLSLGLARISLDKSAISASALKPALETTTGAGAGDESEKAEGGDEAKPIEADKAAQGDKSAETDKAPAGEKSAEGEAPAKAEGAAAEVKPAEGDKGAQAPNADGNAPAEGAKKVEGGE